MALMYVLVENSRFFDEVEKYKKRLIAFNPIYT